jgi:hypothetical protein
LCGNSEQAIVFSTVKYTSSMLNKYTNVTISMLYLCFIYALSMLHLRFIYASIMLYPSALPSCETEPWSSSAVADSYA